MLRNTLLLVNLMLLGGVGFAQETVIRLYDGKAPGSEDWTHQEQESTQNVLQTRLVYNVTDPTLTVFAPEKPNGTGLIICPGGGFHFLSIDSEGVRVAEWLAARGVTCFVLRYRLVEITTRDPVSELFSKGQTVEDDVAPVVDLATADGLRAIEYVRDHADEFHVNPSRIGLIGFSAGGTVAVSVAYQSRDDSRPNFLAPIYAQYDWALRTDEVPANAPPIFLVAASDDQLGLAEHSIRIYQDWMAARKPAELHIFTRGGHGFGMRKQNLATDQWIERFADWMKDQGFLK